ncbi:autotransporter outer membrane beta-barrel domain-containing protein [Suttonella sp. R2A3]|uniref:autotransporter outer membrane beta-barrel domain-containing protein n=1 Tax=Suttonella sp. R2A3 TaxID=2908648 RepID=UPI001F2CDE89|nr:autotransporter outer membrane beta-barrel domain-containing protein [Suttonella sp. R2A3]UJF24259.1 autotransporter outer membrane beta-barrel domain-containing protein [Suttonella sp. R2A3]
MNHIYKTIWNEALGVWVAVSELSKQPHTRACSALSLGVLSALFSTQAVGGINCPPSNITGDNVAYYCTSGSGNSFIKNGITESQITLEANDSAISIDKTGNYFGGGGIALRYKGNEEASIKVDAQAFDAINTNGTYARGIYGHIEQNGDVNIVLGEKAGSINTAQQGSSAVGARVDGTGDTNITMNGGEIRTMGDGSAHGLDANTHDGNAQAVLNAGSITTNTSSYSAGVAASVRGKGTATATMNGGNIIVGTDSDIENHNSIGVAAIQTGSGAANATMTGGTITVNDTQGIGTHGVQAVIRNTDNSADATARMTGGEIYINNNNSRAVITRVEGQGNAIAEVREDTGSTNITVNAHDSNAIFARIANPEGPQTSSGNAYATLYGGTLDLTGDESHAIRSEVQSTDPNAEQIAQAKMENGQISTDGVGAHGVLARFRDPDDQGLNQQGTAIVSVNGGTITTQQSTSTGAYAFHPGSQGRTEATQTAGEITTNGEDSDGLVAKTSAYDASDSASITTQAKVIQSGGSITTSGNASEGIVAQTGEGYIVEDLAAFANAGVVEVTQSQGAAIKTSGNQANGITAQGGQDGTATITQAGSITTTGAGTYGLPISGVFAAAGKQVTVQQNDTGEIFSSGNQANGITAIATQGDITLDIQGNIRTTRNALETRTQVAKNEPKNTSIINISDSAELSGEQVLFNDGGHSITTVGAATLAGAFSLNDGNDQLTFNMTDLSNITEIDGGVDVDVSNEFDNLTLNDIYGEYSADRLKNWERININRSQLTLTGDNLIVGKGSAGDQVGGLFLSEGSHLAMRSDSSVSRITGDVYNQNATINLRQTSGGQFSELTIDGDYAGDDGSLLMNTQLGDDNSPTDKLIVSGNTSGKTKVTVTNSGGPGGQTVNGIKLIQIDGSSQADNFSLARPVQSGAYEYRLLREVSDGDFYLRSHYTNSSNAPEIYRPAIPGYVMAQLANQETLNALSGNRLHQRVGEQESLRWNTETSHDQQTWGRTHVNNITLEGKERFALEQNTQLIQFGWDMDINRDNQQRRQHSGIYAGYANSDAALFDRKRSLLGQATYSGDLDSDTLTLGGYHTRYNEQGDYLNIIGGVHYLRNRFQDRYGINATQQGLGVTASVEAGRPRAINNREHWYIEPQAQLSWQMTRYNKFNDAISRVGSSISQSLRPRLGVRIGYNNKPQKTNKRASNAYITANVLQELLHPTKVRVGQTNIREKLDHKTWIEIDAGGQIPLGNQSTLYGSAQYIHTLDNKSRQGLSGQVGLRYQW